MSRARINADQAHTESLSVVPHIIPDVLYPAVAGKLLDNTASHSGAYGTAQADGFSYYYTDINGSKPIKDPRIGAHFGSQRYPTTSLQIREQETAIHGKDVKSVDGRDFIRVVGVSAQDYGADANGTHITLDKSQTPETFIEITGYFSDATTVMYSEHFNGSPKVTRGLVKASVNGGSLGSDIGTGTSNSPLISRHVNAGSIYTTGITATLGINTLRLVSSGLDSPKIYGIELIAQDTTSTTTKSQIQIPSQNVVSYGKKFTVSGTPHYNPFAFAGDGTTAVAIGDTTSHGKVATGWTGATSAYFDSTLDTATSLGLSAWETGGDFYRPVNGGRVVRWVDSTGAIKTSVNMMPPCATAITAGSDASLPTSHAWTTVYQPKIKSGSIDHSQAEVAKTFHWREFGNGSANKGTGSDTADASMLNASDDIAYVMDDGLTSLSGDDVSVTGPTDLIASDGTSYCITFVGTGLTMSSVQDSAGTDHFAQNLPYGTHIFKVTRDGTANGIYAIDGISLGAPSIGSYGECYDVTFHQPKMPPIPEDAVVIADYMLMADFVAQTTAGEHLISKGTRRQSCSRDIFYDETDGDSISLAHATSTQLRMWGVYLSGTADSDTSFQMRIPSFGTNYVHRGYDSDGNTKLFIDTTDNDSSATKNGTGDWGSYAHLATSLTVGVYKFGANAQSGGYAYTTGFDIVSPIHTSSHYQTFETPFLHELVGGDRNMEQTNLVVTPDGKTWDQVTRDVSYIGPSTNLTLMRDGGHVNNAWWIWDWARGTGSSKSAVMKNFALGYNRVIFLEDGEYELVINLYNNEDLANMYLLENTTSISEANGFRIRFRAGSDATQCYTYKFVKKRGDWIVFWVTDVSTNHWHASNLDRNQLQITKIG